MKSYVFELRGMNHLTWVLKEHSMRAVHGSGLQNVGLPSFLLTIDRDCV